MSSTFIRQKSRLVDAELALVFDSETAFDNLLALFKRDVAVLQRAALAQAQRLVSCNQVILGDAERVRVAQGLNEFAPTVAQFKSYQHLFDYFNEKLFGGKLPQVVLNFSRGGSLKNAIGFFAPHRWGARSEVTNNTNWKDVRMHEISLNPIYLTREPELTLSTLVHEMCHLQRQVTGKPPRPAYHDKKWAQMMLEVGLKPISISRPGTMLGQKVTHEIERPGEFYRAFTQMPSEYLLPFSHIVDPQKAHKKKVIGKAKYECTQCQMKVWGKMGLSVTCDDCQQRLVCEHDESEELEVEA
jgi:hypothetical protein